MGAVLHLARKTICSELPALVMGIVNATPDSFWSESRKTAAAAVEQALYAVEQGASIIDIGGESSRPGARYISAEEELERVIPVIEQLRRRSDCVISVDTRKKAVMRAAYEAGADMLNDISALEDDAEIAAYAAQTDIAVILMHKRGVPAIMQKDGAYADAFGEVDAYLQSRAAYAVSCGVAEERIIVDPGIGFGKNLDANRVLIARCGKLCGGRYPVLIGLSRKTCIGDMTGKDVSQRLGGTLAANMLAVQNGASIIRVHDVGETIDMLKVLGSLRL